VPPRCSCGAARARPRPGPVRWQHGSLEHLSGVGSTRGQARTRLAAAAAHLNAGQPERAIANLRAAAAIYADLGDSWSQATTLHRLGDTLHAYGQIEPGQPAWRQATAFRAECQRSR
jgi:hypothetical protein